MNPPRLLIAASLLFAACSWSGCARLSDSTYQAVVASHPAVGDVVFTRIGGPIFTRVAETTESWTSHVGIIVDYRHGDWVVAESGIPVVRRTPLRTFLGRSAGGQFALCRLRTPPTPDQQAAMRRFADAQMGIPYALGFDLKSKHTFCSKFVHDAIYAATHQSVGEVETFDHLLHQNPHAPLTFWKVWFLGSVPWERTTITPASELRSPLLAIVIQHHP